MIQMRLTDVRTWRIGSSPIVASVPSQPGILAAMALSPSLELHLRGIADALLVEDFPGSTLSRGERELIATAVSTNNACCFCSDSHTAFTRELAAKEGWDAEPFLSRLERSSSDRRSGKLWALLVVAERVRENPHSLSTLMVERAKNAGATEGDIMLTVLIASAFCMYNRMVDGLRAYTPDDANAHAESAKRIAESGYQSAA